jgi:hypothetical protein
MSNKAWWGFDIDKTTFVDEGGGTRGGMIGAPIMPMIRRIKHFLRTGRKVNIVTARVHWSEPDHVAQMNTVRQALNAVFGKNLANRIDIRSDKDRHMIDLYDDRAKQVIPNKGILVQNELRRTVEALYKIAEYDSQEGLVAAQTLQSLDHWSRDLVDIANIADCGLRVAR